MFKSKSHAAIHLLPLHNTINADEVRSVASSGDLIACDFYISGAQNWEAVPWGYQEGRLLNLDHHAPVLRMTRHISSGHLALGYVQHCGVASAADTVVINHTDCDSLLSSAIVAGLIEPHSEFAAAALAADHTGEPHPIADLLQALEMQRDYEMSLRSLQRWLAGQPLEPSVQLALEERLRKRALAATLVEEGSFHAIGQVSYAVLDESVEGEFFPALLPLAEVIVVFIPRPGEAGYWNVRLRLGNTAPEGLSLHDLHLEQWDANYGGRWNAGSNRRGGGTSLSPDVYAQRVADCLTKLRRY